MYGAEAALSYSISVFIIVLISGCVINLLRQHHIFQLTGIAFFFTYFVIKSVSNFQKNPHLSASDFFLTSLPMLMGISACLISMVIGFWIFPYVRKKFKS